MSGAGGWVAGVCSVTEIEHILRCADPTTTNRLESLRGEGPFASPDLCRVYVCACVRACVCEVSSLHGVWGVGCGGCTPYELRITAHLTWPRARTHTHTHTQTHTHTHTRTKCVPPVLEVLTDSTPRNTGGPGEPGGEGGSGSSSAILARRPHTPLAKLWPALYNRRAGRRRRLCAAWW